MVRFFQAFLDKYKGELCLRYHATHCFLDLDCHPNSLLTREACQTKPHDVPYAVTVGNHGHFVEQELLRAEGEQMTRSVMYWSIGVGLTLAGFMFMRALRSVDIID